MGPVDWKPYHYWPGVITDKEFGYLDYVNVLMGGTEAGPIHFSLHARQEGKVCNLLYPITGRKTMFF